MTDINKHFAYLSDELGFHLEANGRDPNWRNQVYIKIRELIRFSDPMAIVSFTIRHTLPMCIQIQVNGIPLLVEETIRLYDFASMEVSAETF